MLSLQYLEVRQRDDLATLSDGKKVFLSLFLSFLISYHQRS